MRYPPIYQGSRVKIFTESVYQQTQEPLNHKLGTVVSVKDNEIIVNVEIGDRNVELPFAEGELRRM